MEPVFLTVDDVLEIHRDQMRRYGGMTGIRDASLLQSAVAQPCATFEGSYLHCDIFDMASAYLFHIVMNHPFIDGNKRTGGAAALVFLYVNGVRPDIGEDAFADMVLDVARGKMKKVEIAKSLRNMRES